MKAKENELQIIRVYDAPIKLVWDAWTDVDKKSNWWGPRGFTITTKSVDFKIGGKWIYTMHGPDGVDYPNITTYHEIIPFKKLVYDHGGNEERQKLFTVTVTFSEELNHTIMNMIMSFDTKEIARDMEKFIKDAGGNATWDRLAEFLEDQEFHTDPFFINRTFKAPKDLVFKMWIDPEHLKNWMAPAGASMKMIKCNIATGGETFYQMFNADGSSMFGQIQYKKISPTDLIEYSQNFCDEKGQLCKPPFAPTWPNFMNTTIQFFKEDENLTRVCIRWIADQNGTLVERDTFHQAKAGMTQGWTGSLNKLEEKLEEHFKHKNSQYE